MVRPRLLNPIVIIIQKTQKAASPQDHLRREPINKITRAVSIPLKAQVVWNPGENSPGNYPVANPQGVSDAQTGYVILLDEHLVAAGYTPERGDKIVKIGRRTTELYLTEVAPHAHYEDQGDFTIIKAWFQDRVTNP